MTSAPLFFDVVSERREDQEGKNVLHTIVGMAGVPILQHFAEIPDPEDEAAISVQAIQMRQEAAANFALVLRQLLIAVEATSQQNPSPTQEESTSA